MAAANQSGVGSVIYGALYFGAGFGLIHWALVDATPGMTQIVLAVVPLLALLFAVAHGVERFAWRAVLGAVLMTGYLGGAIATHVRLSNPLLTHTLFPIYVALLLWGGLYLREERLRALVPFRR